MEKEELVEILKKHFTDDDGYIMLDLDLKDKNVIIKLKTEGSILNSYQEAKNIYNDSQKANYIYNWDQEAKMISNHGQIAEKISNCGQQGKKSIDNKNQRSIKIKT